MQNIREAREFKELCDIDSDTSFAHQQASEEVWLEILQKYPEITMAVASNKTIPDSIIERLSRSEDFEIRWTIATKRRLSRKLFDRLAADPDSSVRHRITCNPKAPKEILRQLTNDTDEMVADSARRKLEKLQRESMTKHQDISKIESTLKQQRCIFLDFDHTENGRLFKKELSIRPSTIILLLGSMTIKMSMKMQSTYTRPT
jgi:hypothetical protein